MARFGKYQFLSSEKIKMAGLAGKLVHSLLGYTQVAGFGRFLWFNKILRRHRLKFNNVLDAGCGTGDYSFFLAERSKDINIDACDLQENINVCHYIQQRNNVKNIRFFVSDLRNLEARDKYDFVFSIDVIEHIHNNRLALEKIFDSLKSRGTFYLRIPNTVQKRIFSERFFKKHMEWASENHLGESHTMESIKKVLREIGFNIKYSTYTNSFFGKLAFEIDQIVRSINEYMSLLFLPLLKLFYFIDTLKMNKKEGNGIVILAEK